MVNFLFFILYFFTAFIFLLSSPITAQTRGSIHVGTSRTATKYHTPWLSPAGDFAFGFHQFLNHTDLYLLAIWYAKIPDTIVWYANEGNPVPRGSTVTLTATEGLMLSDPQGSHLWSTSANNPNIRDVSYAYMNDTGNFIIKSNSNDLLWQSFDFPTDTLLPAQILQKNVRVNSRLSEMNFTTGRFQMLLQEDGNLVLSAMDPTTQFVDGRPYYASNTWNFPNKGDQVVYNESGYMYLMAKNGTVLSKLPADQISSFTPNRDYYQRATLNFYGVVTWYYHLRNFTKSNEVGWSKLYSLPGNICDYQCGYNSMCTYDDEAQIVKCDCPSTYSLIDPGDKYGGCKPDFGLWDEDEEHAATTEYGLELIENTFFEDKCERMIRKIDEEQCKRYCLSDRNCAVTTHSTDDNGTCCTKKPLFTGKNNGTRVSVTTWMKVGNGTLSTNPFTPSSTPHPEEKTRLNTVLSVLLSGSVFVNFILFSLVIFFIYNKNHPTKVEYHEDYNKVRCFSSEVLREATDGYKEELGRGAFGTVYKGVIKAEGSPTLVAVKKLDRISNDADKEFKNEVNLIGMTHHKNLVGLIGFCKENDERLLVYEYMSNGSLADCLFGDQTQRPSWQARTQLAQGIARGLLYLHEECGTQIIHCDIKPQNVLLDDHQRARISDFGLSKLLALDQSGTNTAIRGTKGYVAPEWFRNKPVTIKVDVYSFGVLLLEIIFCRKNINMELYEEQGAILTDWVFDCYRFNTLDHLVNDDNETLHDRIQFNRFIMIALWCIQEDPSVRPNMKSVTLMLEGFAEVPAPPCQNSDFHSYL